MIRECTNAGGLEAMYCTKQFSVDGVPGEVSTNLVQLLGVLVDMGLSEPDLGLAH